MSGTTRGLQVVLVRPWTDGRAGGGCCGGEVRDGVARPRLTGADHACDEADPVGRVWRRLRSDLPDIDVQVADAGNVWLPATVFRTVRRRAGLAAALRALGGAGAGAVLVDGVRVGDLNGLDPQRPEGVDALVAAVRDETVRTGREALLR